MNCVYRVSVYLTPVVNEKPHSIYTVCIESLDEAIQIAETEFAFGASRVFIEFQMRGDWIYKMEVFKRRKVK